MAGHLLFNSGLNESSLAPQFKWLDSTFQVVFLAECVNFFLTIHLCQCCVFLCQQCVYLRQYCVFLRQYTLFFFVNTVFFCHYCVNLRQYSVFLSLMC